MKTLSIKQQTNRILKLYERATGPEESAGLVWYKEAQNFAIDVANEYDLTIRQVSQLISLLSPQKKWEQNKADVISFLDGSTSSIFSTKKTLSECEAVVDSNFEIPQSRLKTYAFAKCIEYAHDEKHDPVVIDRHAIKIAYGQQSAKPIIITEKRYRDASEAYVLASKKLGIRAHELQAITWVTYKRIVNR